MSVEPPALQSFDLAGAFLKRQERLTSDLGIGDSSTHPGTRGDDTDLNWIHMLAELLPRRHGTFTRFVARVTPSPGEVRRSIRDRIAAVVSRIGNCLSL